MHRKATSLLGVLLLAACSAAAGERSPRAIDPAVDACSLCSMGVSAERSAQWITVDGVVHTFDEPGCMVAWLAAGQDAGTGFVADEGGSGWVPAQSAWYVRNALTTPMGWNVVAFRERAAADRFAAQYEGARVQDWAALEQEGVRNAHTH